MPFPARFLPVAAGLVLAACAADSEDPRPVDLSTDEPVQVPVYLLAGLPMMPGSELLSAGGSSDAVEAVSRSAETPEAVATWYRRALIEAGWDMVSDVRQPNGGVNLHAQAADGRPVWLIIGPAPSGGGTVLSVIGAVPGADPAAER